MTPNSDRTSAARPAESKGAKSASSTQVSFFHQIRNHNAIFAYSFL
jgi:hypothetical protein